MNTQPVNFSKILLQLVIAATLGGIGPSLVIADVVNINPSKDNTLYEFVPADGDLSNALGFHFFAGETGMGDLRRGVLAFDIAGNIPAGSTILGVTLSLNMSRTSSDTARNVELHSLLADWGEGTSQASGDEGMGAQSVGAIGVYTWSAPQMVADVQFWLDDPTGSNFGWLVLGDESAAATAKRFDTRESATPPVLTIIYDPNGPRPLPMPRSRPTPHPRPTPR